MANLTTAVKIFWFFFFFAGEIQNTFVLHIDMPLLSNTLGAGRSIRNTKSPF